MCVQSDVSDWGYGIQPDWEWSAQTGTSSAKGRCAGRADSGGGSAPETASSVERRQVLDSERRASCRSRPVHPGAWPSDSGRQRTPDFQRLQTTVPCAGCHGVAPMRMASGEASTPDSFRRTTHGSSGESSTALTSRSAVMRSSGAAPMPDWLEAAGGLTQWSSDSLLMLPTGQRNPARLNDQAWTSKRQKLSLAFRRRRRSSSCRNGISSGGWT